MIVIRKSNNVEQQLKWFFNLYCTSTWTQQNEFLNLKNRQYYIFTAHQWTVCADLNYIGVYLRYKFWPVFIHWSPGMLSWGKPVVCWIRWVKCLRWTSLGVDLLEVFSGGDMKTAPLPIFNPILGWEASLTLSRGDWKQQHHCNRVQDVLKVMSVWLFCQESLLQCYVALVTEGDGNKDLQTLPLLLHSVSVAPSSIKINIWESERYGFKKRQISNLEAGSSDPLSKQLKQDFSSPTPISTSAVTCLLFTRLAPSPFIPWKNVVKI